MMVMQRVQIRQDEVPLGEQTVSQVRRSGHDFSQFPFRLPLRSSIRD